MSTPAGRSSRMSESTVFGVGSMMSISRLCVRVSKCSRESLYLCGERMTQYTFFSVGSGTGPATRAPVRVTVSTIFRAELSMTSWSYALSRMRIFCPAIRASSSLLHAAVWIRGFDPRGLAAHRGDRSLGGPAAAVRPSLLAGLGNTTRGDRAAALADREPQALFHGDGLDERHLHIGAVTRHHHLRALRQANHA